MAALKERRALEEKELQIKRRKEELKLETELAAATAKFCALRMDNIPLMHCQMT